MNYKTLAKDCEFRSEIYRIEHNPDKLIHELQCSKAILTLLERAEGAEKERDDYKELFFSYKHVCGGLPPEVIEELVTEYKVGEKQNE